MKNKSTNLEWIFIKIPFVLYLLSYCFFITRNIDNITINKGVCQFINCNYILMDVIKYPLFLMLFVFSIFYILERRMIWTTFILFSIVFVILSLRESYGVQDRNGLLVLILFSQFIAYSIKHFKPQFNLKKYRIYYSIQVIVASYTLSAISKIYTSHLTWFTNAKYMVNQLVKANQSYLLNNNQSKALIDYKIQFVLEHPLMITILLSLALFIELFSGLALINKRIRLLWGLFLLAMHIGIYFFFKIQINPFIYPLILFLINPFYLISLLFSKIRSS